MAKFLQITAVKATDETDLKSSDDPDDAQQASRPLDPLAANDPNGRIGPLDVLRTTLTNPPDDPAAESDQQSQGDRRLSRLLARLKPPGPRQVGMAP